MVNGNNQKLSRNTYFSPLLLESEFNNWMNSPLKQLNEIVIYPIRGILDIRILNKYKEAVLSEENNRIYNNTNSFMYIKRYQEMHSTVSEENRVDVIKSVYKASKTYYASIARRIRRKLSFNEKREIKKCVRNHINQNIGDSSFNYLVWRRTCEDLLSINSIDNGKKKYSESMHYIKTAAKKFDSILSDMYYILIKENVSNDDIVELIIRTFGFLIIFEYKETCIITKKQNKNIDEIKTIDIGNSVNIALIINKKSNSCGLLYSIGE
ncbi:hypothetical protein [Bacillus canaveralius]|uniref:hypothetical protein n=1 Tax=Bacillus canaveralius TaxID=1403243 RepID=UPI000F782649|nr:hypothetical protein [Bacillus canaveralius]RSK49686.1 hypothetical protein EJA13_15520 [Bacillus canaveralius]